MAAEPIPARADIARDIKLNSIWVEYFDRLKILIDADTRTGAEPPPVYVAIQDNTLSQEWQNYLNELQRYVNSSETGTLEAPPTNANIFKDTPMSTIWKNYFVNLHQYINENLT